MPPASALIPFEWPEPWKDASLARLLGPGPFNCILLPEKAPAALGAELRGRFEVREALPWRKLAEIDWSRPGELVLIGDAVWPSVGAASGSDSTEAGPTGLPWLEANGWIIRMARDLAPQAAVWVRSSPPEDAARMDASLFALAQCEAWAHGARRPVWVPPAVASGLAADNSAARAWWRRVVSAVEWWAQRADRSAWPTLARLLVVSDFSGPNAYPATEFLNLAARRNLPWRAALPEKAGAALAGMAAVLYVDQEPLAGPLLAQLQDFLLRGGLLMCLPEAGRALRGLRASEQTHPRFDIHACGKGRAAFSRTGWDDPYLMALDAHLLMSRRHDVVRLFNPGSILAWPALGPDRRRLLVHLLNYSRHGAAHDVALQTWKPVRAAWVEQPGGQRRAAAVRREAGGWEVPLEPFEHYCAVELEGNEDA
jgi:hypothetical protein